MPVQSILMNNMAFRGEVAKKDEAQTLAAKKPAENNGVDKKKLVLALGGLTAIGIAAICIAKGKKVSSELDIEEFRKIGEFDKGIAKAKGKLFTGSISAPLENGKAILEYEKGVLKQSTKLQNTENADAETSLVPVIRKIYSKDENGAKTIETFLHNNNVGIFGGKEWARNGIITVSGNKTAVETPLGLDRVSKKITEKQPDGSWKVHIESDTMPADWRRDIN